MMKRIFLIAVMQIFVMAVTARDAGVYNFKLDTNHSNIGFAVPIWDGLSKVYGKFTDFEVEISYNEKDIRKSSVKAVIKTGSIDTGIEARDQHLRTADFFDVEKYPEITFQSKRIEKKGNRLIAVGDLTMHGVTKEINLPFTITGVKENSEKNKKNIGALAKLVIDRRDYGISYRHNSIPTFIGDLVEIELNLITKSAAPAS